jgi:hypothetical protein
MAKIGEFTSLYREPYPGIEDYELKESITQVSGEAHQPHRVDRDGSRDNAKKGF